MLSIYDARIEVDRSDTGPGIDFEIPGDLIEQVTYKRRLNRRKDEGTIVLNNDNGQFSTGGHTVTLGDRMDMYVSHGESIEEWGDHEWGTGGWGGERYVWSAYVRDPTYIRHHANSSSLSIDCSDYVFEVLSNRQVFNAFEERKIAGSPSAILETVMREEAPDLNVDADDIQATTSIMASGTNLLEFVVKLARRADSVLWGSKNNLFFRKLDNISKNFDVNPEYDIGVPEHSLDGSSVKNVIRVAGGVDTAIDDEQLNQSGYVTVTESNRATFQVATRKSQLAEVELWTRKTGTKESINIRVQKDGGGAPVAPGDTSSDIDNQQLSHHFIADDGFTTFILNEHTLPEPNPWIIVETDGPDGQDIGVDANNTPAYKAHYPFPVSVRTRNDESIQDYSRREAYWQQDNLTSIDAARDLAREGIDTYSDPTKEATAPAASRRAHELTPGDIVGFDLPRERLVGDYMVTETDETYDGNLVFSTLTFQEIASI